MAQRHPIANHPAFVPLVAIWFAALFGLAVAVLPDAWLERVLGEAGLAALLPLTATGRVIASALAAVAGVLLGLALAMPMARRTRSDPRPIYAEPDIPAEHPAAAAERVRRPLRVREELADHPAEDAPNEANLVAPGEPDPLPAPTPIATATIAGAEEGFMILTPQPVHPPRPAPDLEGLLERFDSALDDFGADGEKTPAPDPDPVHAFVARQTGTPAPSPLGGRMPDHQAELRAALDKLARAHREDD